MELKIVKLKKSWLKKSPLDLLRALGAVQLDKREAYPEKVYMSKEDYAKLRKNTMKLYRQEYGSLSSNALRNAVGMELLNFGPNQSLGNAIKPGYVLVEV